MLAVLMFGTSLVQFYSYTMDDSFITFRYAQNLVTGQGLFFNPDDPTRAEGLTSPLYALVIAPFMLLGDSVLDHSKWLGVVVMIGAAGFAGLTTRRLTSSLEARDSVAIAVLCAAHILADPFVAANAVSGMETALSCLAFSVFLLLLMPLERTETGRSRARAVGAGIAAVTVPMLRPEMTLAVGTMLVLVALFHHESRRETLLAFAVFVILGAFYFAARFTYYGLLLPLPFYIKQSGGLNGIFDVLRYIRHALPLFVALLLLALSLFRSGFRPSNNSSAFVLALMAAVVVQVAYYASLTHLMGFGYRYFQPISVALTILGFVGVSKVLLVFPSIRSRPWLLRPFVAAFWLGSVAYLAGTDGHVKRFISDLSAPWLEAQVRVARELRIAANGDPWTIAINDCGAIPFYTGFETIDLAGLNNRAIALDRDPKAAMRELERRQPDLIFLQSRRTEGNVEVLGWENLTIDEIRRLGYDFLGGMPVAFGYEYQAFAPRERSGLIGTRMRAAGLIH